MARKISNFPASLIGWSSFSNRHSICWVIYIHFCGYKLKIKLILRLTKKEAQACIDLDIHNSKMFSSVHLQCTPNNSPYSVHYTIHRTVYTIQFTVLCTLYISLCSVHYSIHCIMYTMQFTIPCTLYTMQFTIHCTLYSVHYSIHFTVYTAHSK